MHYLGAIYVHTLSFKVEEMKMKIRSITSVSLSIPLFPSKVSNVIIELA